MDAELYRRVAALERDVELIKARIGMAEPRDAMATCDAKGVLGPGLISQFPDKIMVTASGEIIMPGEYPR